MQHVPHPSGCLACGPEKLSGQYDFLLQVQPIPRPLLHRLCRVATMVTRPLSCSFTILVGFQNGSSDSCQVRSLIENVCIYIYT